MLTLPVDGDPLMMFCYMIFCRRQLSEMIIAQIDLNGDGSVSLKELEDFIFPHLEEGFSYF